MDRIAGGTSFGTCAVQLRVFTGTIVNVKPRDLNLRRSRVTVTLSSASGITFGAIRNTHNPRSSRATARRTVSHVSVTAATST